jgi:CheY-like chemotaxis protein
MIVLYAEDDIEDVDVFCEVIVSINESIECINTRDGIETITYLENATTLPDMIFLDINMPTMDGKACLKNIKKDEKLRSIPVVIYTTSTNPLDRELCFQLGAVDFIKKPNTIDEAISRLSPFLSPH